MWRSPRAAAREPSTGTAHERIVELIAARDVERAERLGSKHLLAADAYLLQGDWTLTVYDPMA